MATDNNIKKYTAADIEKYHQRQLSAKEMHELEKAALDDPFLADALEGYNNPGVNLADDMAVLNKRLQERTEQAKIISLKKGGRSFFPFLRVAAMIVVLAGAGYLVFQFGFNKKEDSIAQTEPFKKAEIKTTDSIVSTTGEVDQVTAKNAPEPTKGEPAKAINTGKQPAEIHREIKDETTLSAGKANADMEAGINKTNPVVNAPAEKQEEIARASADDKFKKQQAKEAPAKTVEGYTDISDKDAAEKKMRQVTATGNTRDITSSRKADNQPYRNQVTNTFRGRVTDGSNIGVPFANVTNIQDNAGTYTDANGFFNFTSPDTVLNVQVRSIGFENNVSQLRNDVANNQVILRDDRSLNEMVISNSRPNAEARSRNVTNTLEEPEPADGWANYDAYLANNLNIPQDYKTKPVNNPSVEISFEVDKNGEPTNIRIERSLCKKCDKEAIRLVKEGPKWKPNANKKGRTTVTINF